MLKKEGIEYLDNKLQSRKNYFSIIITFLILISSFSIINADNNIEFIPENIEYCENLYFSDYKEFKIIECDLELVEKRIKEVKKWIYDENIYLNMIDLETKMIYNYWFM